MAVQIIKANPRCDASATPRTMRVAAYCRVSTSSDEQETSYESQCLHYKSYIEEHPGWELAGIFADEGISGTTARRRPEFLRMIKACEEGRVDIVLTKSISRFARNTLDCLKYIRLLKERNIAVYFEKENINTLDAKGEVLITIMASIAQQESQSISQNVRIGIQYRMQQGIGRLNTSVFLGLTRGDEKGELVIVPSEAVIVRRIFREYLEGASPQIIANRLMSDGIRTASGGAKWYASTIRSILMNEKYCGDILMQKYYIVDFLTHKNARNTGQFPQYLVENHHEPIVPRRIFRQVQGELMRRGALKNDPARIRYGRKIAFSGRLVCDLCGRVLKRCSYADGSVTWKCASRSYSGEPGREPPSDCGFGGIADARAKSLVLMALNDLPEHRGTLESMRSEILECRIRTIDKEIEMSGTAATTSAIQTAALEEEHLRSLKLERAEHAYQEIQIRILLELIDDISERRDAAWNRGDTACGDAVGEGAEDEGKGACYDYEEFFRRTRLRISGDHFDRNGFLAVFSDEYVTRHVEKITIGESCMDIYFKAGIVLYWDKGDNWRIREARAEGILP